ncbi:MAG: branched-chain amino acid transport system ATP-binding protein [Actinomycetota bacterium]|nr:branched-chain amino acid transport system ATP-binding protein [Actinomycetota bacterium]
MGNLAAASNGSASNGSAGRSSEHGPARLAPIGAAPGPAAGDAPILLGVDGVTVRFGGVVANDDVSLSCREGEITALLGPNGAGKSTLFDVVTGARRPAAGRVTYAGDDVTGLATQERARRGIGRTFQNLALARDLPVFDNVLLGAARFRTYGAVAAMLGLPRVRRDDARLREIAERALETVGLTELAGVRTGTLPYGTLRRIEIARALALGPRLLMMDEPAAGLDHEETLELARAVLHIQRQWGITVLVVEHDLDFVRLVAGHAFVLDFGQVIAGGPVEQVLADARVRAAYLGTVDHG